MPLVLEGNKAPKPGLANLWERPLLIQMQRVCPQCGGPLLQHLFCCLSQFLTTQVKVVSDGRPNPHLIRCGRAALPVFESIWVSIPKKRAVVRD